METTENVEEGTNPDRGVDDPRLSLSGQATTFSAYVVVHISSQNSTHQDAAHKTCQMLRTNMCSKNVRQDCQSHSSTQLVENRKTRHCISDS